MGAGGTPDRAIHGLAALPTALSARVLMALKPVLVSRLWRARLAPVSRLPGPPTNHEGSMTLRSFRTLGLAAAVLLACALAGCRASDLRVTPIKTLLDDPSRFDKQTVRIAGNVTRSLGIMGYGAYEMDDGTGKIPVVTQENGAPRIGAQVGVEGEFRSAFTLGTTTAAAIVEKRRYTPK